jgi:hypothetical protein
MHSLPVGPSSLLLDHMRRSADGRLSLANDLRGNLAVCTKTSETLIALLSKRLMEMSEPLTGDKMWQFFFTIRQTDREIDQDALVSMPDTLADSYLSRRVQAQDFSFFFDSVPFRYAQLPQNTRTMFLKEYLPALFWQSIGQIIGFFFWVLPFLFLYGAVAAPNFEQAIVGATLFSVLVTCALLLLVLRGASRRLRPFPYEGFPSSDWPAFKLGIIQVGVLALFISLGIPVCLVGYREYGFFLAYVVIISLLVSLYVARDYLRARLDSSILRCLTLHLQFLASIRFILSRLDSSYTVEKERIGYDIEAVEGLLRSQRKPAQTRPLIKGAVTTILASLVATGIQLMFSGVASIVDLMGKMPSSFIVFLLMSGGTGITSWFWLRIRSRRQLKQIMADVRRQETLMKTGTQWLLNNARS